jgi:hypothetical protein
MTGGEPRDKPWHWPREWARDEKFWRDVASRTASSGLVAFFAYVLAVVLGYVKRPDVMRVSVVIALGLGLGFGAFAIYVRSSYVGKHETPPTRPQLFRRLTVAVVVALAALPFSIFELVVLARR